ncbi:hypothetical protein Tco_1023863, partial [Tanacetum coccineum]
YREFLQTVLVLDIQRHRYEDEEQETTQNRFSLASLLEVGPQNYQVYFTPDKAHATIVTYGGLCPGLHVMVSLGMPSVSPNERVGKYIALTANAMSADIDDMISEVTYGIKKGLIYL